MCPPIECRLFTVQTYLTFKLEITIISIFKLRLDVFIYLLMQKREEGDTENIYTEFPHCSVSSVVFAFRSKVQHNTCDVLWRAVINAEALMESARAEVRL